MIALSQTANGEGQMGTTPKNWRDNEDLVVRETMASSAYKAITSARRAGAAYIPRDAQGAIFCG